MVIYTYDYTYDYLHVRLLGRSEEARRQALSRLSERTSLSTEPVPVSAYVGSSKNLKDLKDQGAAQAGHVYPAFALEQSWGQSMAMFGLQGLLVNKNTHRPRVLR